MTTPPAPQLLTELKLIEPVRKKIDESYVPNDCPIIMVYVGEDGKPGISYRGSAHVHSDTQIAVWARNAEGGTASALEKNPNVVLSYREGGGPGGRSAAVLTMKGRGWLVTDEATRRKVYDTMPERERTSDADYKGIAIVIDLDSVDGFVPGYRLQMRR